MTKTWLFPVVALALASTTFAQTTETADAELERGVRQAQQGEFELATATLSSVAERLREQGGRPQELARAYVYLSIAFLGLSEEQKAKAQFVEALNTDHDIELSPDEFPPKVMRFFEDARQEAMATGAVATEPTPAPAPELPADTPPIVFRRVDFFKTVGDEEKSFDARLSLFPAQRMIVISDEKNGEQEATYARIPYDNVTELAYEKSAHRRWKTAILLTPFALFSKGKKHWLTIAFDGVPELPQNFVYVRLDKKNYRQILSALEAQTGVEPSVTIEE